MVTLYSIYECYLILIGIILQSKLGPFMKDAAQGKGGRVKAFCDTRVEGRGHDWLTVGGQKMCKSWKDELIYEWPLE